MKNFSEENPINLNLEVSEKYLNLRSNFLNYSYLDMNN